jgi:hypothetical protein
MQLVHSFPVLPQSLLFLRAFFMTMQREWPGIDRYRLDKFYNLVRCVQNEAFSLLKKNGWRAKDITTYNNLMAGSAGPLRASCPIVGLQLHVVEILLDELSDSMTSGITPEQFTHILSPYLQLLKQSRDPAVVSCPVSHPSIPWSCSSVCLPTHPPSYLPTYLPFCLSTHPPTHLFVRLSPLSLSLSLSLSL